MDRQEAWEAVIFVEPETEPGVFPRVAGLSLLHRTARILRRSGIRTVRLVASKEGELFLRWAGQLGLRAKVVKTWEPSGAPALAFPADLAFQHDYFQRLLRAWEEAGQPEAWRVAPDGDEAAAVLLIRQPAGEFASFQVLQAELDVRFHSALNTLSGAVCVRITGRETARQFHRKIEQTMVKPTDGMFARWNRRVSIPLTRLLVRLPVTPNMVTYFTLAVSIVAGYFLSLGGYWQMLWGGILVQMASILDGNDGELARLKIADSDYGTWLDTICDYIAYFFTFGGVALGLYRRTDDTLYLTLGALMFAGFLAAMVLTSRLRRRYTGDSGAGALTSVVVQTLDGQRESILASLAHRLRHFGTRATFSYFVVVFGLIDGWPILLWIAAAGAQFYWMGILYSERFLKQRA